MTLHSLNHFFATLSVRESAWKFVSSAVVYTLPFAGATLSPAELKGTFVLVGLAGDFGAGWGQSLMFLGGNSLIASTLGAASAGYLQVPALLASSDACVRFGGMSATVLPANVGVSAYIGSIA